MHAWILFILSLMLISGCQPENRHNAATTHEDDASGVQAEEQLVTDNHKMEKTPDVQIAANSTADQRLDTAPLASIIEKFTADARVQNGAAYDAAMIPIEAGMRVMIPRTAIVRSGRPGQLMIFTAKSLHYLGHPSYVLNVHGARQYMGVATKRSGKVLMIGTYGEWDSHIEGGASVALTIHVSPDVEILRPADGDRDLAGEMSLAHEVESWEFMPDLLHPKQPHDQPWWGPVGPAAGWTRLEMKPDPDFATR